MKTKWKTYQELELISSSTSESENTKVSIFSWLDGIWKFLVIFLAKGNNLKIWQTNDSKGNTLWHIYNPATGEIVTLSSEAEVQVWLDRYYRS